MRLHYSIFLLLFLFTTSLWAEEQAPLKVEIPENLRAILANPESPAAKAAALLLGATGGNRLFYYPTHDQPATPATWGNRYEDVHFTSADGTKLHGWFIPGHNASQTNPATIVFSHGNAGSIGHHLGFIMWLVQAGHNVFMYDYRGFGKSAGDINRAGMIEDVQAAFQYISRRTDVNPQRILSYGHSLGGAKSIVALAQSPQLRLRGIMIEGTFSSYKSIASAIGGAFAENLVTDELSPQDYISKIHGTPLLVIHGTHDEIVPVSHAQTLLQKAQSPKTFFEVQDGQHGNSLSRNNGAYRARMLTWIQKHANK